jgi:hypothetical protein
MSGDTSEFEQDIEAAGMASAAPSALGEAVRFSVVQEQAPDNAEVLRNEIMDRAARAFAILENVVANKFGSGHNHDQLIAGAFDTIYKELLVADQKLATGDKPSLLKSELDAA